MAYAAMYDTSFCRVDQDNSLGVPLHHRQLRTLTPDRLTDPKQKATNINQKNSSHRQLKIHT